MQPYEQMTVRALIALLEKISPTARVTIRRHYDDDSTLDHFYPDDVHIMEDGEEIILGD